MSHLKVGKGEGITYPEICRQQLSHFERSSTSFSFAFLKRKITMNFQSFTEESNKTTFLIYAIK